MITDEWDFMAEIGATKSKWKLLPAEIRKLTKRLQVGELMTGEEITKLIPTCESTSPYFDADGKPFVLFIQDRTFNIGNAYKSFREGESHYKYHFMHCAVQKKMDTMGRSARYKAKYDLGNPFFPSTNPLIKEEKLDVCQICLREYDFSKYHNSHYFSVQEFNITEFFDACRGRFPYIRKSTHQIYTGEYTKDWLHIARKYKESKEWNCEKCGRNLINNKRILHCHHKNGVKDDNKDSNLEALCITCHSEEPLHHHLKGRI